MRGAAAGVIVFLWAAVVSAAAAQDAGAPADAGRVAGPVADSGAVADSGSGSGTSTGSGSGGGEVAAEMLPRDLWPDLSVTMAPESGLMVGDLLTLTITADARTDDDVAVPRQAFDPFEVHSTDVQVADRDGRKRFTFAVELLAFEPGVHTVGPVRLRVVTGDGTIGRVETEALTVEVGSLLGNEPNAEPKPDTEPVQVMEEDYTLAWIGGGLAAVVLLALIMLLVARWWMRRERPAPPPPPPRPAWDVASEKLEALRRVLPDHLAAGTVEKWADGLSDAVREYLGARFEFEGLESTTDEVVARLRRIRPPGVTTEEVASLLGDCDLVKFAKATADQGQCEQMLEAATRVVHRTKPSFAPAEPPAAPTTAAPAPPGGPA